ncbi:type II toxin-antitoxin system HipA family toxin [Ferruginibacter sp. HRS2-29]|uniref:type II toxin-antitoxin system HipA family toxin n=1 Tax=Ferruginibacter sp. HRS2-29 TaxID=2487334 RepID=UPI0020CF778B|nr:type II toxin-antitoxin system HipA family toxin [Ferruginibacter sp. HRS2-29]MCP9751028.1 type II toxin-antitoxin system HipA family toxin [Ferruginibacter sp. HRS2-29]
MIDTAYVNLWNKRVGAVYWDTNEQLGLFEFEPSFLSGNWDVSPLKMPLNSADGRIFSFPELRGTNTFKGMPGLLADVLPDKYGNALINAWLSKNGRPSGDMNPVELLCFIGKRGMGALEFEPVIPKIADGATKIELNELIQLAQDILAGRADFSVDLGKDKVKALTDILKIGSSAGGARAKAVIAYNATTYEVRSGQAEAPKGFQHWLIKFDGVTDIELGATYGYGRIEMAYSLMANAAGVKMMECRLLEENGRAHFMTRRFDREAGKGKLHVQSFCGLAHVDFNEISSFSYEQLFEVMRSLRLPYPDAEQLFRRMVFNVMARNCDDHTKNFAFIMDKTGKWSLSPAYDVCYSYRPGSVWVSQHSMSINGKRKNINRADLLEVARNMNIKKAAAIIDEVAAAVRDWNKYAEETGVDVLLMSEIGREHLIL